MRRPRDRRTGLYWEKKSNDGSIHDVDDIYSRRAPDDADDMTATGTAFAVFLAALNTPPCHGGFCDWRLPTATELFSLVDLGRHDPAIASAFDTGCSPGCPSSTCSCTAADRYWSSTTIEDHPAFAWLVSFDRGFVYYGSLTWKTTQLHVRAVRGGANGEPPAGHR